MARHCIDRPLTIQLPVTHWLRVSSKAMKLTKLDLPPRINGTRSLTVKQGWLYYFTLYEGNMNLRKYNLSTEEDKEINTEGCEGFADFTFCVNGRIYVVLWDGESYSVAELAFDATEPEIARVTQSESLGDCQIDKISQSAMRVDSLIFGWESYRFYTDTGVDFRYNVFTWKERMCYITEELDGFFLNSFPLDNDQEKTAKLLRVSDNARESLNWTEFQSFVCGDIVYIFQKKSPSTRFLKLNLWDCTVEDITDNVENATQLTFLFDGAQDGDTIYLRGWDQVDAGGEQFCIDNFWKLETEPSAVGEDFICNACHEHFNVVVSSGKIICGSCERALVEENEEKNTMVSVECGEPTVPEGGETLPVNEEDLENVAMGMPENLMSTLKIEDEQADTTDESAPVKEGCAPCSSCGKSRKEDECLQSSTCDSCLDSGNENTLVSAECEEPSVPEGGETLPVNEEDLENVAMGMPENSMSSLKIGDEQADTTDESAPVKEGCAPCSSCGKSREKDECLQSSTCDSCLDSGNEAAPVCPSENRKGEGATLTELAGQEEVCASECTSKIEDKRESFEKECAHAATADLSNGEAPSEETAAETELKKSE
uniref:RanBP2-type domain-containing protein n=1 Tax=Steinernema glaseri TaxID=37863 RepID=A0A1I7ZLL9_9BILA